MMVEVSLNFLLLGTGLLCLVVGFVAGTFTTAWGRAQDVDDLRRDLNALRATVQPGVIRCPSP